MMLMALLRVSRGHVSLTSTGARRPLAAHADAEQRAPEEQLQDRLRSGRAERASREEQDRAPSRRACAEAVGHVAEDRAADTGHDERHGAEHAGDVVAELEVVAELPCTAMV